MPLGSTVKPAFKPKLTLSSQGEPKRGRFMALLGKPGMGKSCLASCFPNPYFVVDPKETGILDLIDSGAATLDYQYVNQALTDWPSLIRFNDELLTGRIILPPERKTLVYESISGFENQAIKHCTIFDYNGNTSNKQGGYNFYGKGDRSVGDKYWSQLMDQLNELRRVGYHILLTGHSHVTNEKNLAASDYMVETCKCSGPVWSHTDYVVDTVFFLTMDVPVARENDNQFARAKAVGHGVRQLFGAKTPYHAAKNRCRMQAKINQGPVSAEGGPLDTYIRLCNACEWDRNTLHTVR